MGVINLTPDSFSDGGEVTAETIQKKIQEFGRVDAIDIGAESTAPMNHAISWETEWERLLPYLPAIKNFRGTLSFDTYHQETIEALLKYYQDEKLTQDFIWNDVSGKFDGFVKDFLSLSENFSYIFCHNLAPERELTSQHNEYLDPHLSIESLKDYFYPRKHSQVIFDPCLGFSKTYEQNWMIIENFRKLQDLVGHNRWLLGFSRKSFLRKKFNLTVNDKTELDNAHDKVLSEIPLYREVWIRCHRPQTL